LCRVAEIRETLNNLILKQPQEWHTQVALPFVKIVGKPNIVFLTHAMNLKMHTIHPLLVFVQRNDGGMGRDPL
jgi:hypothetical protein